MPIIIIFLNGVGFRNIKKNILSLRGPVLKSFMTQVSFIIQVAIIEEHDVPRKFWTF